MTDTLEEAMQRWMRRMERELRGLKDDGDDDTLRETLDTLSKQVAAWQLLYEPSPPLPRPMMERSMPAFHARTIGSNN